MKITKVKIEKSKTRIHYLLPVRGRPEDMDEYTLSCSDAPKPSFYDAANALKAHAAAICEMAPGWAHNLEIKGVSFSWSNDVMGATITALKPLSGSNAPLVINTPHKPETPYSEGGDETNCLTPECADALRTLLNEARDYVDGDRAQNLLPFGGSDQSDANSDDAEEKAPIITRRLAR